MKAALAVLLLCSVVAGCPTSTAPAPEMPKVDCTDNVFWPGSLALPFQTLMDEVAAPYNFCENFRDCPAGTQPDNVEVVCDDGRCASFRWR